MILPFAEPSAALSVDAIEPAQANVAASSPLLHALVLAGQRLFGVALLLLGILMISTLLLLPIGWPLALLGLALLAAPAAH